MLLLIYDFYFLLILLTTLNYRISKEWRQIIWLQKINHMAINLQCMNDALFFLSLIWKRLSHWILCYSVILFCSILIKVVRIHNSIFYLFQKWIQFQNPLHYWFCHSCLYKKVSLDIIVDIFGWKKNMMLWF